MIEFIIGDIVKNKGKRVILQSGNIGYNIIMPMTSIEALKDRYTNQKNVTIYTYLHVREDSMVLYGFSSELEKTMFSLLLSVNKVGPKVAISIMSGMSINALIGYIMADDATAISKLSSGVGLKTAQKIILDLRDKTSKLVAESDIVVDTSGADLISTPADELYRDVIDALVVLGYMENVAKSAVSKAVVAGVDDAELLKEALKYL